MQNTDLVVCRRLRSPVHADSALSGWKTSVAANLIGGTEMSKNNECHIEWGQDMRNCVKSSVVWVLIVVFGSLGYLTRAQEVPRKVLQADFATTSPEAVVAPEQLASVSLTTDASEEVGGKRSMKGDSRASIAEWNEFFHLRQGILLPQQAYRVSFDYQVLARADNAKFYALFRRKGSADTVDWTDLTAGLGATGHAEMAIVTHRASDFALIIGIQHQGALAINNLVIETDPEHIPLNIALPDPKRTWKSPGKRTCYIDSANGDDNATGLSPGHAWKTLDKVNSGEFAAGDRILLRAGSAWTGFLAPGGSGKAEMPIRIGRYDSGAKPRIDAAGKYLATLYLHNVEHFEVSDLDITNTCVVRQPDLTGVQVSLQNFGTGRHLYLRRLDVHDVNGSLVKSEGGGNGIHCDCGGRQVKSRFDDLRIENCSLRHTDRNGITMNGYWSRADWFPSLHVVIRGNRLQDIGGDGIVPIGCDGALIERNVLRGGRQRCDDYAAGIWPWSCDNTIIQFNEVSGMKGTKDGQGYDADWNCRNTLFQYNYSHDNDGGFMLICNDGSSKMPYSLGNVGTIIRYNISQNDGERTFQISGPCRDTQIYNNVFYVGTSHRPFAVQAGNWGGDWSENTRFCNNIFYVADRATFDFGGMRKTVFQDNVFYGEFVGKPDDATGFVADPRFVAPGTGGDGFGTLRGYQLLSHSPYLRKGQQIENNGGRDFGGNRRDPHSLPDIGAWQSGGSER